MFKKITNEHADWSRGWLYRNECIKKTDILKFTNEFSDWSRDWSAGLIRLDERLDQTVIGREWRLDQSWSDLSGDLIRCDRTWIADQTDRTELTDLSDLKKLTELSELSELTELSELSELTEPTELTKVTGLYELVSMFKLSEVRDILVFWSEEVEKYKFFHILLKTW